MLLHKLETTDYSCLVLPRTLTNRRHRFLCFLRAAQLPSQDCVCSPVLLVQYSRVHRSATSATVVFRGGKPAHRKVCWLASYACSHRGIHSALRSQHCRKSEYLKPRITTYDSSCTGPSGLGRAESLSVPFGSRSFRPVHAYPLSPNHFALRE